MNLTRGNSPRTGGHMISLNESSVNVYSNQEATVLVTLMGIILVLAVPANILVLLGYLTSSSARKKPSNFLLINMTFSELLTTLIVIPLQLVVHVTNSNLARNGGTWCTLIGVLTYPFYIVTVATMLCISIDRLYAIRAPLQYKTKMTGRRIGLMITYTWFHAAVFSFLFGFIIGVGYNKLSASCGIRWDDHVVISVFVAATHILLPFAMLFFLNWNLVASLRKQNRTFISQLEREISGGDRVRIVTDNARHGKSLVYTVRFL